MISSEFLAIFYGLVSAATWGAGDFSGGLATKRNSVYTVVVFSQIVGLLTLTGVALLMAEPFPINRDLLIGAVAGISGVIGLMALYRGLADGHMGIIAALTAVITTIVPVLIGIFFEGLPTWLQVVGFAIALIAVWLISRSTDDGTFRTRDLALSAMAGLGFGGFLTLIGQTSAGAVLWPLVAARIASITLMITIITFSQRTQRPTISQLPIIALAGLFDTAGNAFFALAAQAGRLDISAVLASLYPVSTVVLAWFILNQRLHRRQWIGVIAALVAVILITL